jgi:hypothetical protein
MRSVTAVSIIGGCIVGLLSAYVFMTPFIEETQQRESILQFDATEILTVRGLVEEVDTAAREITIRVSYPGFSGEKALFRFPFAAVSNFANAPMEREAGNDGAAGPRFDISTAQIGQLTTIRLLRTPGAFRVLSLVVTVPRVENL